MRTRLRTAQLGVRVCALTSSPDPARADRHAVVYRAYSFAVSNFSADTETSGSQPGGVQSVDRAISVLEILAQRGEAGVSEVAAEISHRMGYLG